MTKNTSYAPDTEEIKDKTLFYLERVLELLDNGFVTISRHIFEQHQKEFADVLQNDHFLYLKERIPKEETWTNHKEQELYNRLKNAWTFGEYVAVHDCAYEILLHYPGKERTNHPLCLKIEDILATNNLYYIEPDEIAINAFIDTTIEFIVENGNPGFRIQDCVGQWYRCFVKDVSGKAVGDSLKLKITNIPGLEINAKNKKEKVIYLEPRVTQGDIIEVEITSLSHTGNSYTFRHRSYDGFLWFKKRGVNRQIFNQNTLQPKDKILAKILYTTEEIKISDSGSPTRLGLIKAIPIKRVTSFSKVNPDNSAATALN